LKSALIAACSLGAFQTQAHAQSAAAFYQGKTVSITVGSGVGGGNDSYARLIARFLPKHIPGNPAVVVKNMPGAGGLKALNYMYERARKDGTEIGGTNQFTAFEPLYTGKKSKATFDALQFNWLGSPASYSSVGIAWHTTGVKTAKDLLTQQLLIGSSGITSTSSNVSYVLGNTLGFKFRLILGYPGGADVDLAIARGEIHGRSSINWDSLQSRHSDWIRDKKVNILYQLGVKRDPRIPSDIPLILDLAETPEARQVLELQFASYGVGYPYMAPPKVPAERVTALRKAYAAMMAHSELQAAATSQKFTIQPVSGEEVEEILRKSYSAPPSIVARWIEAAKPPKSFETAKPVVARTTIEKINKKGSRITFADKAGKKVTVGLSNRNTKIQVGGKPAKSKSVKVGMTCDINYFGDGGRAVQVTCN
jgi:tripartite-type tricarboxylate transporter receptor subunit TctC